MKEIREINKSHSKYPEYIRKCQQLFSKYELLIEKEIAHYPEWHGLDHPATEIIRTLEKQRNAKLKEIQEEYEYLFTEGVDE